MPYFGDNYIKFQNKSVVGCGGASNATIIWKHYWKIGETYGVTDCVETISMYEVGQLIGGN